MKTVMQMKRFGHQVHMAGVHMAHSERLHKFEKLFVSGRFWLIVAISVLLIGILWLMLWLAGQGTITGDDPFRSIYYPGPYYMP